ncbi:lactonase family protein [Thiomonas sp.]
MIALVSIAGCSTLEFAHRETQKLQYAYVTNSLSDTVSAYSIDASSGVMIPVPGSPFVAGNNPNTVAVNPAGTFAYVANGGASVQNGPGTVSAYRVDAATGALIPIPGSPFAAGRYPSSVVVHPAGTFVYVTNVDDNTVSAYRIHAATGALTPIPGSPFAGTPTIPVSPFAGAPVARYAPEPSCITINPAGTFAYVANFGSNSVSAYRINPGTGALTTLPDSPFAAGGNPVTVAIHPAGTFAYVAVLGGRAVLAYRINALTGTLTPVPGHAAYVNTSPSSITVNPAGTFAYVTSSGAGSGMPPNLNVIRIDSSTGALDDLGAFGYQTGFDATFVAVNPAGTFVYVANEGLPDLSGRWNGGGISVYRVNAPYGTLDEIPGSPFATGAYPSSIAVAISSMVRLRIHHGEPRRPLRRFGGHRG